MARGSVVLALGILCCNFSAFGQVGQQELPTALTSRPVSPRFMNMELESGLSMGMVIDIHQDRHGFMWFATQEGLDRWDGYEMKVFKHQPFDSTSLSSSNVWGIDEGSDGTLWLATDEGLNRMDPVTELFSSFQHDPNDQTSLANNSTRRILVASDGVIWVTHDSGASWMDLEQPGVFHHLVPDPDDSTSLSSPGGRDVFEDTQGTIWIGTSHGLNRVEDRDEGRVTRFFDYPDESGCRSPNLPPEYNEIGGILERPEEPGILWVTVSDRLFRIDEGTDEMTDIEPPQAGYCFDMVALTQDPVNPGVLWIANGERGLLRFDIRSARFNIFEGGAGDGDGLLSGYTFSTFTDRSGIIWTSVWPRGLSRFDPSSVGLRHYASLPDDPNSIPAPSVTGLFQSRDGHVWVTTWGPETGFVLTELDRENDRTIHYRHDPNEPTSMHNGLVWGAIAEDAAGYIWLGSEAGLDRLDRSTGRFRHFTPDPQNPNGFRGGRIYTLFIDSSGMLWIGQRFSVSVVDPLQPDNFRVFSSDPQDPSTLSHGSALNISEDRAGNIWIATSQGTTRLDPISGTAVRYEHETGNSESLSSSYNTYAAERRREPGVVWVTTYGAGLNRLETATGKVRHFTEVDGLSNNGVYGFVEDEQGRLWMPTNRGISRFDPETETFRNYGMEIGLQGLEFNSGGFFKGPYGEFFFAGTSGMNSFFPNELDENSTPPQVTLVDLKLFNESVRNRTDVDIDKAIADADEVTLRYDQTDLTFDFAAFHFADPRSNEYAYKLEGWNDDWVYVGGQRSASFTNLDPGEYTFRVKAANSDGVWNEEGTSIRLFVTPPFWATWWFRIIALLAVGGVVFGGYRFRTAQLEARARELEGQVEKRTEELKASNEQLEQSATIVEAINRETSFTRVLTKILEEARIIPGIQKATAIVYMPFEDRFLVRASSGWDIESMRDIRLTRSEARARYIENAEEVSEDIFVAKNVRQRAGSEEMAQFGDVASFLVLRVRVDDNVVAYLVFDNLDDENAFDHRDVELLERLREHITSAFIKARILEDLQTERSNLQSALDELRATQDRLVQSEKMASLGQLTAGIAHEIKNPLNFVNNFSESSTELLSELETELTAIQENVPDDRREQIAAILSDLRMTSEKVAEHGRRADGIVKNMLEHSRSGEGERVPTDINDLLEEYLVLSHHALRSQDGDFDVHIERDFDDSIGKVEVVPQEMGRVFMNLIGNAFDALREAYAERQVLAEGDRNSVATGGPALKVSTAKHGSKVEIRISDNGPGIPDHVRDKIFEPFFTTKPTGSGTGLGLSMSYDIVTKGHRGELDVVSEPGQGATFVVRLPV